MEITIKLVRRTGNQAYYAYPKDTDTNISLLKLPVGGSNDVPTELTAEVPQFDYTIGSEKQSEESKITGTTTEYHKPTVRKGDVPNMFSGSLQGEVLDMMEDKDDRVTLTPIYKGTVAELFTFSQSANLGYYLNKKEIKAQVFAMPMGVDTLMTNRYYAQVVTVGGKFHGMVIRDYSNKYAGWNTTVENFEDKTVDMDGNPITNQITIYKFGNKAVWGSVAHLPQHASHYIQSLSAIEWNDLNAEAKDLVNSWLSSSPQNDLVEEEHDKHLQAFFNEQNRKYEEGYYD